MDGDGMKIIESLRETESLHEMMVKDNPSLPPEVENSIYYPKLKALLHKEIFNFCKYKPDLKMDQLNI